MAIFALNQLRSVKTIHIFSLKPRILFTPLLVSLFYQHLCLYVKKRGETKWFVIVDYSANANFLSSQSRMRMIFPPTTAGGVGHAWLLRSFLLSRSDKKYRDQLGAEPSNGRCNREKLRCGSVCRRSLEAGRRFVRGIFIRFGRLPLSLTELRGVVSFISGVASVSLVSQLTVPTVNAGTTSPGTTPAYHHHPR